MTARWLRAFQRPVKGKGLTAVGNALQRDSESLNWFFQNYTCDSLEMRQLYLNFLRAAQHKPSVQKSVELLLGIAKSVGQGPTYAYVFENGQGISHGFLNTPPNWVPPEPRQLFIHTIENYWPDASGYLFGDSPTYSQSVVVSDYQGEVDKPFRSLYEMNVGSLHSRDRVRNWLNSYLEKFGPKLTPEQMKESHLVMCIYKGDKVIGFWLDEQPEWATSPSLRAISEKHPFLRILPPQENCPIRGEEELVLGVSP